MGPSTRVILGSKRYGNGTPPLSRPVSAAASTAPVYGKLSHWSAIGALPCAVSMGAFTVMTADRTSRADNDQGIWCLGAVVALHIYFTALPAFEYGYYGALCAAAYEQTADCHLRQRQAPRRSGHRQPHD